MNWKLENGTVQLTNLSHLGIAVKDAEKTARLLSSIWNIGTPQVSDYEPKKEELFVGEPFKVRLVFIKFGAVPIELLQPLDNKSIWSKFIAEKGEGIHHIALGVSNYDEMTSKFQEQNHKLLVSAIFAGERWCYFEANPGGLVIEFREEYTKKV
ncbi:MAG: VOC family protein [Chloroflexi bacterium]|nr:VOC family protein [Chloroflexota bacterium]